MSKSLFTILATLPLLLAALLVGREQAPRACEPRLRVAVHTMRAAHAVQHERTAIDDDDEYDDSDDVDTAMLAPPNHQVDELAPDATSDGGSTCATYPAFTAIDTSLRMNGRGIRSSGEHRSTADRPPRS
jgi:hypothetical protein